MAAKVQQKITVGGTSITFTRTVQFAEPDDYDHMIHKTKAGGTVIYTRSSQLEWDVDVICTKAEADTTIRAWITARSQVVFIPDLTGAPGVSHNTRIMNRQFSMRPWSQSHWRGILRLRKE